MASCVDAARVDLRVLSRTVGFAAAPSRLLHIAAAQWSVTCNPVVTGRCVMPLEAPSEPAPAAEGSRAHALVPSARAAASSHSRRCRETLRRWNHERRTDAFARGHLGHAR